jgi:hypothetical protein
VLGPRALASGRPRRVVLSVPVPADLVAGVKFANRHPAAVRPSFWQLIEDELSDHIAGCTPPGALRVNVVLDPDREEVILVAHLPRDAAEWS